MSADLTRTPLGSVITRIKDQVKIEDDHSYSRLTIRMNGKGIDVRDTVLGFEIGTKKQFIAKSGQLVLSKIDARNGAFGVLPEHCDRAIITGNFWAFDVDQKKLLPKFFDYLTKTPMFLDFCIRASEGTTNRQYLQEGAFLAQEIDLPPLAEQCRIVARIEELAAMIGEAQGLRNDSIKEILALPRALLGKQSSRRTIRVGEFARLRPPDVKVEPLDEYHFAGVYSFGRGVFRGQRKRGSEFAYPRLTRLRAGNFVYPKLMAWEGALGIVPAECDGLVVSTEFPVFEIDETVMLPEVIDTYFRSPEVWPGLSGQSGGTNVRRRRLNPNDFLNLQIPWPDQETQSAIRECVSHVSVIRTIQTETATELDAMLPTILDKAFKGDL